MSGLPVLPLTILISLTGLGGPNTSDNCGLLGPLSTIKAGLVTDDLGLLTKGVAPSERRGEEVRWRGRNC